jgi:heat shock protein HslJ
MKLKSIGILVIVLVMQACSSKKSPQVGNTALWVSGYKTECDAGAGKMKCLMVGYEDNLEHVNWQKLYATIEGFQFKPGIVQQIEVEIIKATAAELPADKSALNYKFIKVLEEKKDNHWELQGNWVLNTMEGVDLNKTENLPNIAIDLTRNQVSGSNGCNNFSGDLREIGYNSIRMEQTISTLKACMDMPVAGQFDAAFDKIRFYKVKKNELTLYDSRDNQIFTFKRPASSTADIRINEIWVAIAINKKPLNKKEPLPRLEVNLDKNKVYGNNGCNEYNGTITAITDKKISFGPLATTRKMCPDMDVPTKYEQAMQKVASYKYEGLNLKLYDDKGNELISFLKVD